MEVPVNEWNWPKIRPHVLYGTAEAGLPNPGGVYVAPPCTTDCGYVFYVCPAGFQAVLGIIFINIFLLLSFGIC